MYLTGCTFRFDNFDEVVLLLKPYAAEKEESI